MTMRLATFIFAALALAFMPSASRAQDNTVIGAPELQNFSLPGARTTPPRTQEPPAPVETAPEVQRAEPAPVTQAAPRFQSAPQPSRTAPAAAQVQTPAPVPVSVPPATAAPDMTFTPLPSESQAEDPGVGASFPVEPAEGAQNLSWGNMLWPALAAGIALLLGFLLFQRRRRLALAADGEALERAALPEEPPRPAPVPTPRPVPVQLREDEDALRPVMEIEFEADRMVATDRQAAVHFGLTVRNMGGSVARNVRIEARMFNASKHQDQEIRAFLASPAEIDTAPAALTLQSQHFSQFRSSVTMPRENVREIHIDGRPLFIPTVAVRIVYQWGRGRSDQAHRTYVIGIENRASADKMGPFRLDLGPRIYRSVGRRQIELARA